MPISRRELLRGAGATLAAASLPVGCAPAVDPAQIDTVVLCMMENRSFDHVFGGLTMEEGRTDVDSLQPGMTNTAYDGTVIRPLLTETPCVEPDPPHGWAASHGAVAGGSMEGFVKAYEDRGARATRDNPLRYLDRSWQPISYALADEYALCQRWFSSLLTSTWPNRLYFHAAQSQGMATNDLPGGRPYTCRTLWDQLDDAGVEWRYFFSLLPTLSLWGDRYRGRLELIEEFFTAARAGALPPVCVVDAAQNINDDHPPNHPLMGQLFLGSIFNALATSPHWGRCLLVVTYDEGGGFYDHVAPGKIGDDRASEGYDQLGVRVPGLVCGPFVRNVVDDTVLEHASAIREVQRLFGIDERLTLRNEVTNDLSSVMDEERLASAEPNAPVQLPTITISEEEILGECEGRARAGHIGQPELQEAIHHLGQGDLDRSAETAELARFFLETAERLGVARVI